LLVAADTYRPAAVTQLEVLGRQIDIPVHSEGIEPAPPDILARSRPTRLLATGRVPS
jgi:signal recognition particle subunit SRP54